MRTGKQHAGPELQDVGTCLRGLVQVLAVDHVLDDAQRKRVRAFAVRHGFDPAFVDAAIESVLDDEHFPWTPPRFKHRASAEEFLREAVQVALCDGGARRPGGSTTPTAASASRARSASTADTCPPISRASPAAP